MNELTHLFYDQTNNAFIHNNVYQQGIQVKELYTKTIV